MDRIPETSARRGNHGLSYKFQRLRERLREAVASGELSGKLPGERALAKRFDVNPKTLSKALTDLAAEGLLDRSIGRGTFVKGTGPQESAGRWLVLGDATSPLIVELRKRNADLEVVSGSTEFRPSFINSFSAVVDATGVDQPSLHRSLNLRGIKSVVIGEEMREMRTHGVLLDWEFAAFRLAKSALLNGCRHLVAIESPGRTVVSAAIRQAIAQYEPSARVESCAPAQALQFQDRSDVTMICDANIAADKIASQGTVNAIGITEDPKCTGYFISPASIAQAVEEVFRDPHPHRPSVLWLLGDFFDSDLAIGAVESAAQPAFALTE